ncbi:MAG TPA: hypothetical protein VGO56_14380 [Pyrinomonadaceae bacterium]|jgi:hypothetical protein|nr:hypothetical protein [Pyrinomonadaceae bacterium]
MKTEGDYPWDRSGEPDPEVQQLEEILGTLRYQPRALEIPAGIQVGRERKFFSGSASRLAIAAAIAALFLGLGLFFGLQRLERGQPPEIVKAGNAPKPSPTVSSPDEKSNSPLAVSEPQPKPQLTDGPRHQRVSQTLVARNSRRIRNAALREQQLALEQKRAEAAKDQLMLALRVVSEKFGYAQKKAQELNQKDQVHNQHKIG